MEKGGLMEKAVLDYILTCTFAAFIGETLGFPWGLDGIFLLVELLLFLFGYFYSLRSFADDYARWLKEPAEPQVPLGMIHPRKARARFEFRHAGIPETFVGDSGSIPVGAR